MTLLVYVLFLLCHAWLDARLNTRYAVISLVLVSFFFRSVQVIYIDRCRLWFCCNRTRTTKTSRELIHEGSFAFLPHT